MAIDLLNLEPTTVSRDLKGKYIMIYGVPKCGKTTLGTSFPNSLLLAFEAGYNGLAGIKVQPVSKWTELKTILRQLSNEKVKEAYSCVVIDTIDLMVAAAEKYVCQQNPIKDGNGIEMTPRSILDIPWGKGTAALTKEVDDALREIAMMGYGIVLISHSIEKTKSFGSNEDIKIEPSVNKKIKLVVNRFVDMILYLKRVVNPETGEEKRFMFTRDTDEYEAGSRFKYLPSRIEANYDNLVVALHDAIDKEAAEKGVAATELTQNNYKVEKPDFVTVITKAREMWIKINDAKFCNEIIEDVFGRPMKLSDALPTQIELVEEVIARWGEGK